MDATEILRGARIVPVVVIDSPDAAVPLAETLVASGLRYVEITLRTDAAIEAIERIAAGVPDAVVGAGSIRAVEQLPRIRDAGARFAVSPGYSDRLLEAAADYRMPFVPGAVTAAEILGLRDRGYTLMKFFPAELAGGVAMLQALGGPLPEARFFPTGGISADRAADYLALPNVHCIGGSWITPAKLLAAGDYAGIGNIARQAAANGDSFNSRI